MKRTYLIAGAAWSAIAAGSLLAGCSPKSATHVTALTAAEKMAGLKTVTLSVKGMT